MRQRRTATEETEMNGLQRPNEWTATKETEMNVHQRWTARKKKRKYTHLVGSSNVWRNGPKSIDYS